MLMPSREARRIVPWSSTVSILASVPRSPGEGTIGTDAAGVGPFYLPSAGSRVGPVCTPITRRTGPLIGAVRREMSGRDFALVETPCFDDGLFLQLKWGRTVLP